MRTKPTARRALQCHTANPGTGRIRSRSDASESSGIPPGCTPEPPLGPSGPALVIDARICGLAVSFAIHRPVALARVHRPTQ